MTTIRLEAPEELLESLLAERRRLGADRHDEVWDGVLHMVPSPTQPHQNLAGRLSLVLGPLAHARGLEFAQDLELHRPGTKRQDYREPDLMFYPPTSAKIVEKAEVVIEILSPGDESLKKVPWYGSVGVKETFLFDGETRRIELFGPKGAVRPTKGRVRSKVLGVTFETARTAKGPKLKITWKDGEALV